MMSLKRKSDALLDNSDETELRHLVICFTVSHNDTLDPVFYKFESYPIEKFITKSETREKLEPDACFTWEEKLDEEYEKLLKSDSCFSWRGRMEVSSANPHPRTRVPPYCDMRFLNVRGLLYAVGGHKISQLKHHYVEEDLPRDLTCILLSASLRTYEVELRMLSQMHGRKYVHGIVEIGGLIYVLSSPRRKYPTKKPFFEVYDPLKDEWVSLPDPPFINPDDNKDTDYWDILSYGVVGTRLYLSTYQYSCIYDTALKKWGACDLFSDFPRIKLCPCVRACTLSLDFPRDIKPRACCGPPFPFRGNPVFYKEKFWLVATNNDLYPIRAFHIIDEKKVVEIPVEFSPSLPYGVVRGPLLDIGDDYFIAMLYENDYWCIHRPPYGRDDDGDDDITILTFKTQLECMNDGFILRGTIMSLHKIEGRSGNGGLWNLVDASVNHSSNSGSPHLGNNLRPPIIGACFKMNGSYVISHDIFIIILLF